MEKTERLIQPLKGFFLNARFQFPLDICSSLSTSRYFNAHLLAAGDWILSVPIRPFTNYIMLPAFADYLRIENAEGNVLISVYLYACVLFA